MTKLRGYHCPQCASVIGPPSVDEEGFYWCDLCLSVYPYREILATYWDDQGIIRVTHIHEPLRPESDGVRTIMLQ